MIAINISKSISSQLTKLLLGGLLLSVLAGCSLLTPAKVATSTLYTLNGKQLHIARARSTLLTLLVLPPQTSPPYATKNIAYVLKPHQIAYFAKNTWAAEPTKMLLPLIVDALRQSKRFKAVVSTPFVGKTNLRLYTNLIQLQQNFIHSPSQIHMRLSAQLLNSKTGKIIAAKQFNAVITAPKDTPHGGVIAANRATNQILQKLVRFCVRASRHVQR